MTISAISFVSMKRIVTEETKSNVFLVKFHITRHPKEMTFEVPITLSAAYDEDDAVRVAKALLHSTFSALAEGTQTWAMTEDAVKALKKV